MYQQPHREGERVTVFWPGGPYNFDVRYHYAEPVTVQGWEDWFVIHGTATPSHGEHKGDPAYHRYQGFYVHPVDGGYALLPVRER